MSVDQARANAHFKQKKEELNPRVVDALRLEQIAYEAKVNNMNRLRTERFARNARLTEKQRGVAS